MYIGLLNRCFCADCCPTPKTCGMVFFFVNLNIINLMYFLTNALWICLSSVLRLLLLSVLVSFVTVIVIVNCPLIIVSNTAILYTHPCIHHYCWCVDSCLVNCFVFRNHYSNHNYIIILCSTVLYSNTSARHRCLSNQLALTLNLSQRSCAVLRVLSEQTCVSSITIAVRLSCRSWAWQRQSPKVTLG